jgi:6-phosphogluconolactonase
VSALALVQIPLMSDAAERPLRVFIGTYTGAKSRGIYRASFDPRSGTLSAPELAAETKNPSFLAMHPNGRFLYAVGEIDNFQGRKTGAVNAFAVDERSGSLTLLNQRPSGGTGPCHVSVDGKGRCVLVANYGSGSVAALPLLPDGRLGEPRAMIQHEGSSVDRQRQSGPHAHFIIPDAADRYAYACDLGLDKVLVYRLDPAQATLTPQEAGFAKVKPGSGPRHLVFDPKGRFAYVFNEMGATVTSFEHDPKRGTFKELQTLPTLPEGFDGQRSGAEIQLHPSGKYLYCSNRGHDSIAAFEVNSTSGELRFIGCEPTGGKTPRHFTLTPDGEWLLAENQDSNNIAVFRVDKASGRLKATGQSVEVGSPVCVVFSPGKGK